MTRIRPLNVVLTLALSWLAAAGASAASATTAPADDEDDGGVIVLRLLDPDGKPAAGASVGTSVELSDMGTGDGDVPRATWWLAPDIPGVATSDDRGEVRLPRLALFGRAERGSGTVTIIAMHDARGIGAIADVADPASPDAPPQDVRLEPLRHVRGTVTSAELDDAGRPLERARVTVKQGRARPIEFVTSDFAYDLRLPSGGYQLVVGGRGRDGATAALVTIGVEIIPRPRGARPERPLTLEPVDLPIGTFAELLGDPAPELRSIRAWKPGAAAPAGSNPAVTLAGLGGRVVVLFFWNGGRAACVAQVPTLADLHAATAAAGLAVVGVHDDSVRSVAELDARVLRSKRRVWKGQDPPFPTAIDTGAKDGPFAAFGVSDVPFIVLVGRDGNVLASFEDAADPAFVAAVEQALATKP